MAHGIYILTLLLLVAANFHAAGARRVIASGKHLSFSQVKNPRWVPHQVSTTEVYAAPFLKHKQPMPPKLQSAFEVLNDTTSILDARANGQTVSGSSGEFVFPVQFGSPAQTLHLVFDTGSGDLWVWSWEMSTGTLGTHARYNATPSTTSEQYTGQSFNIAYASGTVYGNVWLDNMSVSGNEGTILVEGNPIECAQNVGGAFSTLPAVDGILGLNTWVNDQESPSPQQTWLNYVLTSGIFSSEVFTAALVRGGTGVITFGSIDTTKYTGSISYASVVSVPNQPSTGFWSFYASGYNVGSHTFNSTSFPVITDSGTNLSTLPNSMVVAYYAQVTGAFQQSDGSWAFPCSTTLPNFTFGVGTGRIVVSGSVLSFSQISPTNCYGGIQATSESGFAIFGTPFFNSLFIVHDVGNNKIGFAQRASLS